MLQPAVIDIKADRWVMCRRTFAFVGYNLTGATFKMQIRLTRDAGTAIVTLTTQTTDVQGARLTYGGSDTVANHLAAARLSRADVDALLATVNPSTGAPYVLTDTVLLSIVAIRVDKTTMSTFQFPQEIGDDQPFYYDLHITPSGGDEDVYAKGQFVVLAGSTQ